MEVSASAKNGQNVLLDPKGGSDQSVTSREKDPQSNLLSFPPNRDSEQKAQRSNFGLFHNESRLK